MTHLPVNWREGSFLVPQHFQSADRHWAEIIRTSQGWDHPYHYGLSDFKHTFEGDTLRIDKLLARMRDGTLICLDEDAPALTVDLGEALEAKQQQMIYLCVPELKPGEANVREEGSNGLMRYISKHRDLADENESGGEERAIEFRQLNVCLKREIDDRAGYVELPVARVRRPIGNEQGPQLDGDYIPPVLAIDAWTQLGKGFVRGAHDLLVQNVDDQADELRDAKLLDNFLEASQSGRFALLDRLNEVTAVLGVMVPPALGVHPFVAYMELCRTVGKLSIFTHNKSVGEIPKYNHNRLGEIFREVCQLIKVMLESIQFKTYLQKNFEWQGDIMVAELTPAWFDERVKWFIGVCRGDEISVDECRRLLSRDNDFLWKFGSMDRDIRDLRAVSLDIREDKDPSQILPNRHRWSYWHVNKDANDPNFRAISNSHKIAVYMKDGKNPSLRPEEYVGTNRFPVAASAHDRKVVELNLSIFGLRDEYK